MPLRKVILLALAIVVLAGLGVMLGVMNNKGWQGQGATKAQAKEKGDALQQAIGDMWLDIAGPPKAAFTPPGRPQAMARYLQGSGQPHHETLRRPASNYLYSVNVMKRAGIWRAEVQATSEWDRLHKDERVQLMKDLWLAWSKVSGDDKAAVEVYLNGLTSVAHADTTKPKSAPDGRIGAAFISVELRLRPLNPFESR